ncbi:translation initiation factor IF-2-like [Penaeus monodon]|uniref:translation initiation factor IF-2-like n=1 Tax=Penaeus monodon TaxID=6687 RepID=UPI0018A75E5D|nr:translation initiation factor IF-2-like [Penaeus monodon]
MASCRFLLAVALVVVAQASLAAAAPQRWYSYSGGFDRDDRFDNDGYDNDGFDRDDGFGNRGFSGNAAVYNRGFNGNSGYYNRGFNGNRYNQNGGFYSQGFQPSSGSFNRGFDRDDRLAESQEMHVSSNRDLSLRKYKLLDAASYFTKFLSYIEARNPVPRQSELLYS